MTWEWLVPVGLVGVGAVVLLVLTRLGAGT